MTDPKTPYDTIAEPIVAWCEEHGYTDILVTIWIDDYEHTELLEFDPTVPDLLIWRSDWWEGEKDVRLLGFAPLSDIHIHTMGSVPAADVQPVRHGRWVYEIETDMFQCSCCNGMSTRNDYPFCHWCGIRMDLKEDGDDTDD